MQPIRQLISFLEDLPEGEMVLLSLDDFHCVLPGLSRGALKVLAGRAERDGVLWRVCKGLYLSPRRYVPDGFLLYRVATRLRAGQFNYLSLESVLSDVGVISQVSMQWITVMSSGRSRVVDCGRFGRIEFVHTKKQPADVADWLTYDARCRFWRASVPLAMRDMKSARRSLELVDQEALREFV